MQQIEQFIQAGSKIIFSGCGLLTVATSVWNGSPVGQAVNPYFSKAPVAVEAAAKATKSKSCKIFEGVKYCK